MSTLLFGFYTVLPIFLLILAGVGLRQAGMIPDEFIAAGTRLIFYCALPCRMFLDVAESDIYSIANGRFIIYIVAVTVAGFILVWLFSLVLCRDRTKRGAFIHSAFRGNYVYIGIPVTCNILQMASVPCTVLVIAFAIPLYNILGVLVLSWYTLTDEVRPPEGHELRGAPGYTLTDEVRPPEGHELRGKRIEKKKLVRDLLLNPLILAVLAGIPFALFEWKLPGPLSSALSSLGAICMPLALLFIGASIRFRGFLNNLWLSLKAAVLKVIILPCLFLPPAVFLAFTTEEIVTAYVMLAVPTALNAYIVTKNMGGDEELSSGIIVATILLSVLTFPVGIWILRFFLIL